VQNSLMKRKGKRKEGKHPSSGKAASPVPLHIPKEPWRGWCEGIIAFLEEDTVLKKNFYAKVLLKHPRESSTFRKKNFSRCLASPNPRKSRKKAGVGTSGGSALKIPPYRVLKGKGGAFMPKIMKNRGDGDGYFFRAGLIGGKMKGQPSAVQVVQGRSGVKKKLGNASHARPPRRCSVCRERGGGRTAVRPLRRNMRGTKIQGGQGESTLPGVAGGEGGGGGLPMDHTRILREKVEAERSTPSQ